VCNSISKLEGDFFAALSYLQKEMSWQWWSAAVFPPRLLVLASSLFLECFVHSPLLVKAR